MFLWLPHVLSPWRSYKLWLAWIIFHLVVLTWHIILPGIVSIRAPDLWLRTLVTSEQRIQCYLCANEHKTKSDKSTIYSTENKTFSCMNDEYMKIHCPEFLVTLRPYPNQNTYQMFPRDHLIQTACTVHTKYISASEKLSNNAVQLKVFRYCKLDCRVHYR